MPIWSGEKPLRLGLLAVCFLLVAGLTVVNAMLPVSLGIHWMMLAQFGMDPQSTNLALLGVLAGLVVLTLIKVGPNPDAFRLRLPTVGYFYDCCRRDRTKLQGRATRWRASLEIVAA